MPKLYLIPHIPIVSQLSEEAIAEARIRLAEEVYEAAHTNYLQLRAEYRDLRERTRTAAMLVGHAARAALRASIEAHEAKKRLTD